MKWLRRYVSRNLHYLVPLPIMLVALVLWAREPAALVQFRLHVFDEFLRLKPRVYVPTPVRIVDIDDDSLEQFGQWPWPRTLLAKLVSELDKMGAAAIVFDILFLEPDRTTPSRIINEMERDRRRRSDRRSVSRNCRTTTRSSPTRSSKATPYSFLRCAIEPRTGYPRSKLVFRTLATTPAPGFPTSPARQAICTCSKRPPPATPSPIFCPKRTVSHAAFR